MSDSLDRLARLGPDAYTYEVRPVASPAVGTDFSITVNDGGIWRVRSLIATLTTSAVVANRIPNLRLDDQTNPSMIFPPGPVQAASLAVQYVWLLGFPVTMAAAVGGVVAAPLVDHVLHQGWRIRPVTSALDAGDQWSGITITIERVLNPPNTIQSRFVDAAEHEKDVYNALEAGGFIQ